MKADFDQKRFTCKYGYCTGKAADLTEPVWQSRAQEYKRRLSAKMRSLSGEDAFKIPKTRGYVVTRKYDGEFAILVFDGKRLISVNPGGTARSGLPCLDEAEKLLKKAKLGSCVLGAEIYVIGEPTTGHRVQQAIKILRNPTSKKQLEKLGLAVFDVLEVDGEQPDSTAVTFKLLKKLFGKGKLVKPVESRTADKPETIMEMFTEWVIGEGAEGIVVRHDKMGWYKIKARHNIDAAVIGYSEGSDERKDLLHDLLVAVVRPDGTYQELCRVGGGFTDEDRKTIREELRRRIVPSEYVAVNNDYVAYEMIEPGPVIEISCLDMIAETTRGGPVNRMVLEWDGKKYLALSRMPLVSVISPQFVRFRDDKEANAEDVSIRQIAELKEVADTEKPAGGVIGEPSKILERTVYVKTMRGNKMVRKLLLWKTNKEDRPEYPGYVVYLTDFSPNRQNPLERDIRVAATEKGARKLFTQLAEKNFIGGWEKAV